MICTIHWLTPVQVPERLQARLLKRIAGLEGVKRDGYGLVISELRAELNYLERAAKYLEK